MSRVPYLDRLGDEFERAVTESAPRRQFRGGTVLAITFVMVLLAGASLWVLRDGRAPDVAQTSTTTTASPDDPNVIDAPTTPDSWARVPSSPALDTGQRTTLSGITTTDSGFAGAGTMAGEDESAPPTGVIVVSPDGIEWESLIEAPDVSLSGIAFGTEGLLAVGMRSFMPVVVNEGGTITDLPVLAGSGERAISARAASPVGIGYVVVGEELHFEDEHRARGSVWWSEDGVTWTAVESPAFGWYHEAYINDVVVTPDGIVAVGLVGAEPGTTLPTAWLSPDGTTWEQIELPTDVAGGFTVISGVAFGHGRYVAVGEEASSSGTDGTAWVSGDGRTWEQVDNDSLAGADRTTTRIASIAAVDDGFVAVGHSLEIPASRHVIWTADTTGLQWSRLDLADPGNDVSTTAFGVAANSARVVVAGATFDITYSEASGAIWVGPAPLSLEASTPITTTTVAEDGGDLQSLEIDLAQAVGATSVRVVGRLPAGHGLDEVVVRLEGDTSVELCRAVTQGRNFMCRVTLADLEQPPALGVYSVVATGIEEPAEPAVIEVLPEGSQIIVMNGIYTPRSGPIVQSVSVQNKGGAAVDISGWAIVNERRDEPRFEFPEGTAVPAGRSAGLDFRGVFNAFCSEDTDLYFHWCRVVSDSDRIDYHYDEENFWKGATLQLLDTDGDVVAEWRPGS